MEILPTPNDEQQAEVLAIRKALQQLGLAAGALVKERGYGGRAMFWLREGDALKPLCLVGPLTHSPHLDGKPTSYFPAHYVELVHGAPGEGFFNNYFRMEPERREALPYALG